MFYDGLAVEIKKMMVSQDYDHSTVSYDLLMAKALQIDSHLDAFKVQNKATSSNTGSGSKSGNKSSTATLGAPGNKLSVGDHVYQLKDNKAVKGKIVKVGKNAKGKEMPMVQWDDGTSSAVKFKSLKLDSYPLLGTSSTPAPKPSSSSGPAPMDLDSATSGKSKGVFTCHNCGGRGHMAAQCPSKKAISGATAEEESSSDSENEDS